MSKAHKVGSGIKANKSSTQAASSITSTGQQQTTADAGLFYNIFFFPHLDEFVTGSIKLLASVFTSTSNFRSWKTKKQKKGSIVNYYMLRKEGGVIFDTKRFRQQVEGW